MPNTVIALKKSSTPGSIPLPANLANGELAINFADGKLFYKNTAGQVAEISGAGGGGGGGNYFGTINANGTLVVSDTTNDVLTIIPGTGISIVGDAINDTITITATGNAVAGGSEAAFNQANAAFNKANSILVVSNTAPTNTSLWFNSDIGKLFVYYQDADSSQWIDTTRGQFYPIGSDVASNIKTINTSSSVLTTDSYILANGTINLTLPSTITVPGREFRIKNIGSGVITIIPQSGETIDDRANLIIGERYSALTLLSTGSSWLIF